MKATDYLNYKVDIKEVDANAEAFEDLSLEDKKRFLIECLDKTSSMCRSQTLTVMSMK